MTDIILIITASVALWVTYPLPIEEVCGSISGVGNERDLSPSVGMGFNTVLSQRLVFYRADNMARDARNVSLSSVGPNIYTPLYRIGP